jgi:hypothetical protein
LISKRCLDALWTTAAFFALGYSYSAMTVWSLSDLWLNAILRQ